MIEDFLHRPWVVAQLRASAFGPDLDALTDELQHIGYSVATIQNHLHAAGHLAYWLTRQGIAVRSLSKATIHHFVERHLPHCRCPIPRASAPDFTGVAPHLLRVFQARRRILLPRAPKPTPIEVILQSFTEHLQTNRGAAPATCERHVREIRPLLKQTYGSRPISVALTKGLNLKFIAEYCGTSVAMIEQPNSPCCRPRRWTAHVEPRTRKTATFGGGCSFRPKNPYGI